MVIPTILGPRIWGLTLIGCGLGTVFEVVCHFELVPRNISTMTGSGTKYKWFSVHPHMAWDKLTNPRFNRSLCQGYCSTLPPLASKDGQQQTTVSVHSNYQSSLHLPQDKFSCLYEIMDFEHFVLTADNKGRRKQMLMNLCCHLKRVKHDSVGKLVCIPASRSKRSATVYSDICLTHRWPL